MTKQFNAILTAKENECAWLNANTSPGAGSQCEAIYDYSPECTQTSVDLDYTWNEGD